MEKKLLKKRCTGLRTRQTMESQGQSIRPHKQEQGDVSSSSLVQAPCTHNVALFMEPEQQRYIICIDMSYEFYTTESNFSLSLY